MREYLEILCKTVNEGTLTSSRNGNIVSLPACMFAYNMEHGFPLITTKKITLNKVISELLWFLAGSNNELDLRMIEHHKITPLELFETIKLAEKEVGIRLTDNYHASPYRVKPVTIRLHDMRQEAKVLPPSIWSPWADRETGYVGQIYGPNWRNFRSSPELYKKQSGIDQIDVLEKNLSSAQMDSRRMLVTAWNPYFIPRNDAPNQLNLDTFNVSLPACHHSFQLNIVNGICSLIWNQRSVDVCVGLPFNIASYALLLLMICNNYNLTPGWLVGHLANVHVYEEHVEKARLQLERVPYQHPNLTLKNNYAHLVEYDMDDFVLHDYQHHAFIHYQIKL
jgi:thymidylate synthase